MQASAALVEGAATQADLPDLHVKGIGRKQGGVTASEIAVQILDALTRWLLPAMLARGDGRIIQNSSVLGLVAMPFRGAYNASKFALEGLSDTLRMELAGTGVHVVLIEPGPVLSRFRANALVAFRRHVDAAGSRHADTYAHRDADADTSARG